MPLSLGVSNSTVPNATFCLFTKSKDETNKYRVIIQRKKIKTFSLRQPTIFCSEIRLSSSLLKDKPASKSTPHLMKAEIKKLNKRILIPTGEHARRVFVPAIPNVEYILISESRFF